MQRSTCVGELANLEDLEADYDEQIVKTIVIMIINNK
jgi:hypothetical protein